MRAARLLGTTVLSCLVVATIATGCDGSSRAEDPPRSASATTSSSPPSTSTSTSATPTPTPTATPDHSVNPPGKRTGAIAFSDILVNGAKTLSPATIKRIKEIDGVQDVEPIALAEVIVENQ